MLEIYLCTYLSFYKDSHSSYIHLWFQSTRLSPQLNSTSRNITTSVIHELLLSATIILVTIYDPSNTQVMFTPIHELASIKLNRVFLSYNHLNVSSYVNQHFSNSGYCDSDLFIQCFMQVAICATRKFATLGPS